MKKIILTFAALLMVVSGVAAVSAYEAHIINVRAHVENALTVTTGDFEMGVLFPQETRIAVKKYITLSQSAQDEMNLDEFDIPQELEGDLKYVQFSLFAERKVDLESGTGDNHLPNVIIGTPSVDYYAWIGDWLGLTINGGTETAVGVAPVAPLIVSAAIITDELGWVDAGALDIQVSLDMTFYAPAFEGFYNTDTDPISMPGWWNPILKTDTDGTWPSPPTGVQGRYNPAGVDLGLDLKVQVIDIVRWPAPTP